MLLILAPKFNRATKTKQTCQPAPSSIKQPKCVDKTWKEEATTITTTQSSNTVSAAPVSSMIAFESPAPTTKVLPSPAFSVSSCPSVPASTNAVPPLKDVSIYIKPASPDVIHSIPSHKFVNCSFETTLHRYMTNLLRIQIQDAGGPLREMFTLFYEQVPQYLFYGKENQYVFRHDAYLVDNSDFENLGKLMTVGFLLGLPRPRNWSVPLSWYILGSQRPCTISDVPIHEVMVKLENINNGESQKMLDVILEDFMNILWLAITRWICNSITRMISLKGHSVLCHYPPTRRN